MAGAKRTGACVAMTVVDSISSAMPLAILPIIFAVAGATTIMSAFSAKEICFISYSFVHQTLTL
jgi:hypothetical protein